MNETSNQMLSRPNIRIEIKNKLADEAMDVDVKETEGEDGEIFDYNEMDYVDPDINFLTRPTTTELTEEETMVVATSQQKLSERAKRFALENSHNFSEEQFHSVCDSLGIPADDPNVRYEAIYLYSIGINLEDCLKYFSKYSPIKIEWISKNTCNVTWTDKLSAAKAMYNLSKCIAGLPVTDKSDSLVNANREIEIDGDNEGEIHVRDIKASIPPGYWRLGNRHYKMKYLLMRFSLQQDNKPYKVELYDSINFNFYEDRSRPVVSDDTEDKNPWGNLARNWYEDAKYAEPDYKKIEDEETVKKRNFLQHRLGFKRAVPVEEAECEEKEEVEKKSKIPRMRMYADEEEAKIKRRQELKTQIAKPQNKTDLRTILNLHSKNVVVEQDLECDLGSKLKNRRNRLQPKHIEQIPIKPVINTDARSKLNKMLAMRSHENTVQKSSDRYKSNRNSSQRHPNSSNYVYDDDEDYSKTSSKVAVVIKKQKSPAVASTVWSRINEKDRLKIVSEGKLKGRYESSDSTSSSSTSSSSADSDSDVEEEPKPVFHRIGFSNSKSNNTFRSGDHKSPLRIEISNNHFRKN